MKTATGEKGTQGGGETTETYPDISMEKMDDIMGTALQEHVLKAIVL